MSWPGAAIRIGVLGLFECTVKSPHLVCESKSLYSKIADPVMISYTLELIIRQIRRRQVISMAVYLCRGSAEILL